MKFKNKKIIVTGGAGFIGSTLTLRLLAEGAQVKVLDNLWRGKLSNLKRGSVSFDLKKDFQVSDLTNYSQCLEYLRDADLVYHLADVVAGVDFVFRNEPYVFRQNVVMNSNVLAACIVNKIPNYIYVGTACSYPKHLQMQDGIVQLKETQTYPAAPESSYGWSKLMGEYEAELAGISKQINVGLLRFHNVYGPFTSYEHQRSQVIPSLIMKTIAFPKKDFVVWGSGQQYRDFLYIDDAVAGLLLMAQKGMNKGLIQLGSEKATTIKELAGMICDLSRKRIKPKFDASQPEGDRGRIASCERARKVLGWQPKTSLEKGLRTTYNWLKKDLEKQQALKKNDY